MLQILGIILSLSIFSSQTNTLKIHKSMTIEPNLEIATLGSGCFWCSEAVFENLKGVISVESGYSGGFVKNPSYREVCNGTTGHAEVVQIKFDPAQISYKQILEVFFSIHDPTSMNKQGADEGTQYRSVIFYHNPEQKKIAEELIAELSAKGKYQKPIVTQIDPFTAFYKAEDYHQDYFSRNPNASYCSYVIQPKLEKFKKNYSDKLKGN
ncbi:MAG: peptide-methionine (S)-S-oxide reductase MsrA [Bacteroidales bacterium]|nr:peptide-methionine (S)-S-oxide reductase MsrA [Bacteroidales bacterium]